MCKNDSPKFQVTIIVIELTQSIGKYQTMEHIKVECIDEDSLGNYGYVETPLKVEIKTENGQLFKQESTDEYDNDSEKLKYEFHSCGDIQVKIENDVEEPQFFQENNDQEDTIINEAVKHEFTNEEQQVWPNFVHFRSTQHKV